MRYSLKFSLALALVLVLVVALGATAGTLVFPQTTATSVTECHYDPQDDPVPNASGCGEGAHMYGGQFILWNGSTVYANSSVCARGYMAPVFRSTTTDFTATLVSSYAHLLTVVVNDVDPETGLPTIHRKFNYAMTPDQPITVSGAGTSIYALFYACATGTANCDMYSDSWTPFKILSVSASQPVLPNLDLRINRNSDGTSSAVVTYSAMAGTLTISLLPSGQEPGTTYFSAPLTGSGTIVQPLPSFDTDRIIQAIGTGCDGNAERYASLSCQNCFPGTGVGDPVRLYDGAMTYAETDPLPSTLGSEFRREYSSAAAADGRFGLGWSSLFDASAVTVSADNKYVGIVKEDRTKTVFHQLITGEWAQTWPMGGVAGTLSGSEATGYVFRDAGGSIVRTFGTNHHLTRLQDLRRNRAISITYDANGNPTSIADENGNWSCTITTTNGHITTIGVDGRPDLSWTYAYTGSLLSSVTVAGAPSAWRTYQYTNNRLSAILDASGAALEQHNYDAQGRAITSYGPSGDITNVQYPATDTSGLATTSVTRADASVATFEQAFSAGAAVTRHADGGCSSCGAEDATAAYDANGNVVRLQNARGYITESDYSNNGRHLIKNITAMTPTGCDPATDANHCRLTSDALSTTSLSQTTASLTTNYVYGDANWPDRATQVTRNSVLMAGNNGSETFTFDPTTGETVTHTLQGFVDAVGTQESHITTTTLYGTSETPAFTPGGAFQTAWLALAQPAGLKKSIDGPRTDVTDITKFVYYPVDASVPGAWRGQLAAIQDALGHITQFADYDVFGHATTITDPNGVATRSTFDALGRTLTSTISGVPGCNTTVDPLCATELTMTRTYAAGSGALATEQRPAGNLTTYTYDSRGRLQTLTRGTATTPLEKIDYTYDPTSQKKASEVISAFQNNTWVTTKTETYTYTSDGHLSATIHADNTRQVFAYLPDGMLSSVQDENHNTPNTTYSYDPANRLSTVTQALAGAPSGQLTTSYGYDIQGNLTSVTDPNGNVTTYVFDDFGRMQRQVSPVSGTTT